MWLTLPAATQWGWHINKQMDICMHDLAVRVPTHFSNWDRQMKDTAIRKLSNRVGVTIKSCQVLTAGDELVHDHELCAVAWMRAACVRKWRAIIRNRASWSYSHTQYTRWFRKTLKLPWTPTLYAPESSESQSSNINWSTGDVYAYIHSLLLQSRVPSYYQVAPSSITRPSMFGRVWGGVSTQK